MEAPLAIYEAPTSVIGGLFPLLVTDAVPAMGARIGYDSTSGSAYYCDPLTWVSTGAAANPNILCLGEPGRGKSALVKAFLLRMMLFGTRVLISGDVKGEYTPLMHALDLAPIRLGAGSPARLNALDLGPLQRHWPRWSTTRQREELHGVLGRWTAMLVALAEAQGIRATVTDEATLTTVLRQLVGATDGNTNLRPVTIPHVVDALANPEPLLWHHMRFASEREFLDHTRHITDALGNLVGGPLAGLFDAETNFDLDWEAPMQSMDLSGLTGRGDRAVAVALTCLGAWSALTTDLLDEPQARIVVRDEVWRQMRLGLRAVQAVDAELRLSRVQKKIQMLIAHKPSDPLTVGNVGSQEVTIARDLLALCSTRILCGQSTRIATELADDFALGEQEQASITGWAMERRGRALWKVEHHPGRKVQLVLSGKEMRLFDTNRPLHEITGGNRLPHHRG